jgi:hypothetical protein
MSNVLDKRVRIVDLVSVLAGLAIVYFGGSWILEKIALSRPRPLPGGGALPQLPPPTVTPPAPSKPQLMTGPTLQVFPGRRYGVALDTPGALPTPDSKVKEKAAALGFTNVDVFDEPPKGWPGMMKSDADTYIVGFYSGQPKSLPRSHDTPVGSIDVIEAWEG